MIDNPNDSALEKRVTQLEELLRANPLEAGSFAAGGISVFEAGKIRFLEGGGIVIDGDGSIDLQGTFILEGAQVVREGGSITVEGTYPIVIHNNGSGEALVEIGDGGIVGNASGLTLLAAGGVANIAVKADKIEINRGGKAFHVTSTGFLMGGVPPEASTSGLRLLAVKTDGTVVSVPIGSGGSGPGTPVDPTDPTRTYRWPFARTPHGTYDGHSGIDWPRSTGTPIKAIGAGVVEQTWAYGGNIYPATYEPEWRGNCIMINHGMVGGVRVSSLYAHMQNAPTLAVGAAVTSGQVLGAVGNTGASDGSHLHFEIIFDGVRLSHGMGGYERAIAWMDANASGSWG